MGAEERTLQAGDVVGRWVVSHTLGQQERPTTAVVQSQDNGGGIAVLKLLDLEVADAEAVRGRIAGEVQIIQGLSHPGLPRILEYEVESDQPWLVSEFCEGTPLSEVLANGTIAQSPAIGMLGEIAEALALLHERGVAHRDLRPASIVVREDGRATLTNLPMVLDPGCHRLQPTALRPRYARYLPPEWLGGGHKDPIRWDVYMLGSVFWEVLVGRQPFNSIEKGGSPREAARILMDAKRNHPSLDPGPEVPFWLRALVRDMTHPEPSFRPADAREVLRRLDARDAGAMDPVDLFQTPMPSTGQPGYWESSAPGAPTGPPAEVRNASPAAKVSGTQSFLGGALVGGLAVAVLVSAWAVVRLQQISAQLDSPALTDPLQPLAASGQGTSRPDLVTTAEFARWIDRHPEWEPERAINDGRALEGYREALLGSGAVVSVPWGAAVAYCEKDGGLPYVGDRPWAWTSGDGPDLEWRHSAGMPAWRAADGRVSTVVKPVMTSLNIGFRCAGDS